MEENNEVNASTESNQRFMQMEGKLSIIHRPGNGAN